MMLKWCFDFSTGFRFSKISVECFVHICSCPWLGVMCKGKTLLVIDIFITFFQYCTVTVQYCCSVSKEKHDKIFSAASLNGRKIQILLQLRDPDSTWRVASTAHWTLIETFFRIVHFSCYLWFAWPFSIHLRGTGSSRLVPQWMIPFSSTFYKACHLSLHNLVNLQVRFFPFRFRTWFSRNLI